MRQIMIKHKKALTFQPELIFYLQFPFVFHRFQSLQLLPPIHLCPHLSIQHFRPSAQRLVLVSLQLSFLQTSVSFRPLHFGFWLLNLCFWFSLSSWLRLTVTSSVLIFHFHFRCLPRYLLPDFSCIPSRFWYSHLLYVSFHPSLIRSHSCSSGAYF